MTEAFLLGFGLIVGSFLNVVIYRLPQKQSIVTPGSRCRICFTPIRPLDNIPLLSFLILRGRCRFCKGPISVRYPAIEFVTGLLFILLYFKFGITPLFVVYTLMVSSLLVIALIDLDHKIIPNIITIPGVIVGFFLSLWILPITPLDSLLGLTLGGTMFYVIALVWRGGMGGGDIKLIAMIGSFLGLQGAIFTMFSSALLGSVIGVILILLRKKGRKDTVPFGPFLAVGAIIYIFYGDELIHGYLNLFYSNMY
jgi:leader peptidase (prepilin peptidase) / N-methyltransferase